MAATARVAGRGPLARRVAAPGRPAPTCGSGTASPWPVSRRPALLPALLADADRRVAEAALVNPRLREEDLVTAVRRDDVAPGAPRGGGGVVRDGPPNYAVRLALVLQPRTPLPLALLQISSLVPRDLRRVAGDAGAAPARAGRGAGGPRRGAGA